MSISDNEIEKEIQDKGLTAPRVTPQMIEDAIAYEYGFTAWNAVGEGAPRSDALKLLTLYVIVLKNGFTATGESACASPENFNESELFKYEMVRQKVGEKLHVVMPRIKDQEWDQYLKEIMEGYLLKSKLHEAIEFGQSFGDVR